MERFLKRTSYRLSAPRSWSIPARRVFLLTLPVSAPALATALGCILIVSTGRMLSQPLLSFWNDPPRRRRGYADRYGERSRLRIVHRSETADDGEAPGGGGSSRAEAGAR